jgi:hypothetical protein
VKNLDGKRPLEDPRIDGRIMLIKMYLKVVGWGAWTELI